MANGIQLNVSTDDVKNHVTAISYVTKQNDDCETQLVDLLAGVIEIKHRLDAKQISGEKVSDFDKEILRFWRISCLWPIRRTNKRKSELYRAILYVKYP